MNLELLISKYLDGQLSDKEDNLLRSMIKEDDVAKQKFYSAVNIHMAFKDDAEAIEPPKDVIRDTEDKVMMKIMAQPAAVIHEIPMWRKAGTLAMAASFFLLITVFNISDLQFGGSSPEFADAQPTRSNQATVPIQDLYSLLAHTRAPEYTESESSSAEQIESLEFAADNSTDALEENLEVIESSGAMMAMSETEIAFEMVIPSEDEVVAEDEIFAEESIMATEESISVDAIDDADYFQPEVSTNRPMAIVSKSGSGNALSNAPVASVVESNINPVSSQPGFNSFRSFDNLGIDPKKLKVSLNSFLGTDVMKIGMADVNDAVVTHFSQSIGYSDDEVNRYGLEIGYSEYNYRSENFASLPGDFGSLQGSSGVRIIDPVRNDGSNMFVIPSTEQKKVFFGAFFYERSLLNGDSYQLDGRVTVGMSSDGGVGLGRIFGSYELLQGVALTAGLEARMFNMKLTKGSVIQDQLRGSVSMIYGVRFTF